MHVGWGLRMRLEEAFCCRADIWAGDRVDGEGMERESRFGHMLLSCLGREMSSPRLFFLYGLFSAPFQILIQ